MAKKEESVLKFEKGLEDLEGIVESLESGEVDLEEALKRFEKGVKLTRELQEKLENAQRKVKKLIEGKDGVEEEDFDPDGPGAASAKTRSAKSQDTLF